MSYSPIWDGISEFVALVECGTFTAAAKRLGISTAQVSRQVSSLEKRLNTELVHRTTRKVVITELGNQYYQQCHQLLEGLENAENALMDLQTTPKGKLKITAPITYGEQHITPHMNDFLQQYPELDLHIQLTNQTLDLIDGGFDLAIRLGRLEDSRLKARKLGERQAYTCASPGYLNQFGEPHSLSELSQHNCLLGTLDHWYFQENGSERAMRVSGNLRCNSGNSLVDAALKGIGIIQLPDDYVIEHIQQGRLIKLLENNQPKAEGIWGIYPSSRGASAKVRLLLDHLSQRLHPQ